MRRLLVVAAAVVVLAAAGAFAGEVKGPPNQQNNTNETGALDHANSACAASGLNDFDTSDPMGQFGVAGSDRGGFLEVLPPSEGRPRHARTLPGRNGGTLVVGQISWLAPCSGPTATFTDTAALPLDRLS